jgi:hypothetical protein
MMKAPFLSRFVRRTLRRGETGQTIVILAFGFIVLLAFIGIVTDVSLLFVRYTTLRRAVDAAAVAAAGQVRRPEVTTDDLTKATSGGGTAEEISNRAAGYAYARNVATVNLTARQYIEFYGLQPSAVLVDTCATVLAANDPITFNQLLCANTQQPRKLVKVTAQIESFTTFLRLIGWDRITLQATSISETAVLDIVMIFDVSESMAVQTSYDDWANIPNQASGQGNQSMRYLPPRISNGPLRLVEPTGAGATQGLLTALHTDPMRVNNIWDFMLKRTQRDLLNWWQSGDLRPGGEYPFRGVPFWVDGSGNVSTNIGATGAPVQPREECRIRFWPYAASNQSLWDTSATVSPPPHPSLDLRQEYTAAATALGLLTSPALYPNGQGENYGWSGFVPAFNYFGCCNDPNGDQNFSDLICQPFRQLRQASDEFIQRIDFSRGDRVAFVTFDRDAYLIDPPGAANAPMMTDPTIARNTLSQVVGVRAEPNFYADTDGNGYWDGYVIGGTPWTPGSTSNVIPYNYNATGVNRGFNERQLGLMNDYPVFGNCYVANAAIRWPNSLYASPASTWYGPSPTFDVNTPFTQAQLPRYAYNAARFPTSLSSVLIPPLNDADWDAAMSAALPALTQPERENLKPLYSYQFRAGCRDSNVGASLRVANNALTDPATVRVNGAVWVMVMLGDGAAAGTDPMTTASGGALLAASNLFPINAIEYSQAASGGQYGSYGACPYGTAANPGPLTDDNFSTVRPYCSDRFPETRTLCTTVDANGQVSTTVGTTSCFERYDADDYARDWADFVAKIENPKLTIDPVQQRSWALIQRPTIYTIGFGLDFRVTNRDGLAWDPGCLADSDDCLGEELLRYIADVGDNNRVDSDWQQDRIDDGVVNLSLRNPSRDDWGDRGPCENPLPGGIDLNSPGQDVATARVGMLQPLAHGESCGNYYNAPDQRRLRAVFDDIAGKLFTRITR